MSTQYRVAKIDNWPFRESTDEKKCYHASSILVFGRIRQIVKKTAIWFCGYKSLNYKLPCASNVSTISSCPSAAASMSGFLPSEPMTSAPQSSRRSNSAARAWRAASASGDSCRAFSAYGVAPRTNNASATRAVPAPHAAVSAVSPVTGQMPSG